MNISPRNNLVIGKKIDLLFGARLLAEQCEQLLPYDLTSLLSNLKKLQLSIYCLDKYFEHTWILHKRHIDGLWSNILSTLRKIVGDKQNLEELVRDIRAYQRLEESIRGSSLLLLPQLQRYYYLKTCDVRLARNIIMRRVSISLALPMRIEYLQAWELFDLASEVCDDLEDIDEDLGTFNGNRFLLEISITKPQSTINSYQEFELLLIQRVASLRMRINLRHPASKVLDWAAERLTYYRELLSMRATNIEDLAAGYTESLLGTYRTELASLTAKCNLIWPNYSLMKNIKPSSYKSLS